MAITLIDHKTKTGKTSGTTLVFDPLTVVTGDQVVVMMSDFVGGSAPSIADDLASDWFTLAAETNSVRQSKWYALAPSDGSMTITITFGSSSSARAGIAAQFRGPVADGLVANPPGLTFENEGDICPESGILAHGDEVVLGFWSFDNGQITTNFVLLPDTGIPDGGNVATTGGIGGVGDVSARMSYRIVSTTASVTPTCNTQPADGVSGTAAFTETAGPQVLAIDPFLLATYGYVSETGGGSYLLARYGYLTEAAIVAAGTVVPQIVNSYRRRRQWALAG